MSDPQQVFRRAEQAFVGGRQDEAASLLAEARRLLPNHPAILHLSGLNAKALGELDRARISLEAAHRLAPGDHQIANNLGNLLKQMDQQDAALKAFDAALHTQPDFVEALVNRAITLTELGRFDEARLSIEKALALRPANSLAYLALGALEYRSVRLDDAAEAYDRALALAPDSAKALRGRAKVALDRGEQDGVRRHELALQRAPDDRDLYLDWVRALDAEDRSDAADYLAESVARHPDWPEALALLATLRWERGDKADYLKPFEEALERAPGDEKIWEAYTAAVAGTAGIEAGAEAFGRAYRATGSRRFQVQEASYRSSTGALREADLLFAKLSPDGLNIPLARHLLRKLQPADAEALLLPIVDNGEVPNIPAWALLGLCWQLTGDDRFQWLHGQPGLIETTQLPFSDDETAAIAATLRGLHRSAADPIGQSVRGGTQTRGDLFDRTEPNARRMRSAILEAVENHRRAWPARDTRHPLLRFRDRPFRFAGSWSIRLAGGGFHVSHIHPKGLLSSASYWALPEPSPTDAKAGWLEIGGSPHDLPLPIEPVRMVEPKIGMLALFPSTLHHGTRPFPAGERITAAFDAIPT